MRLRFEGGPLDGWETYVEDSMTPPEEFPFRKPPASFEISYKRVDKKDVLQEETHTYKADV